MAIEHYYNEIDPFAIAWLTELMKDGLIPHGQIDTRPIQEVAAADVRGFTQCHFFAGLGEWPLALRIAGWPQDRSCWTGSCPCPPFSVAGKRKSCPRCEGEDLVPCPSRTGFFLCCLCGEAWLADDRHLWPEWWRLLRGARPGCPIFGEQVASEAGRAWLAVVRATLAILDHGAWGADLCSAGVGKDHIRQRLCWMADPSKQQQQGRTGKGNSGAGRASFGLKRSRNVNGGMADATGGQLPVAQRQEKARNGASTTGKEFAGLSNPANKGSQGRRNHVGQHAHQWDAIAAGDITQRVFLQTSDGNWRPVPANREGQPEPALFPLVSLGSVRNRVGILRGAGNAIDVQLQAEWIAACADVMGWELR